VFRVTNPVIVFCNKWQGCKVKEKTWLDRARGVGVQPLRLRSKFYIEVINQRDVVPFIGVHPLDRHPVDQLRANEPLQFDAPKRAVCNTPIAGRSPFRVINGGRS